MTNRIRRPVAASAAGIFLIVVFCTAALCTRSFLEKNCGIDFAQARTILLIGLVLAAVLCALFARWGDRLGRKWVISSGVLLGILGWAFLFRPLPAIAGTAGRAELSDQKEIRSTVAFIGKSRDYTRTTATFTHFADGMQEVETKEDTVFAGGRISAHQRTTLSNTLNNSDYWKVVAILSLMALSGAMVCGPIAARIYALAIPPEGRKFAHVD
jgi:hypothetical protein